MPGLEAPVALFGRCGAVAGALVRQGLLLPTLRFSVALDAAELALFSLGLVLFEDLVHRFWLGLRDGGEVLRVLGK